MSKSEHYYHQYLSHRHISRRGLFRAFTNASKIAVQESTKTLNLPQAPLPPGAISPLAFYQRCTQCLKCIEACSMGVLIKNNEGYPQLAIEYASCDGCNRCIENCFTGALLMQPRFDTHLRPVFGDSCSNPTHCCEQCISACPVQACFTDKSGIPAVDNDRCIGCGECFLQCHVQAITLTLGIGEIRGAGL